MKIEHVENGNGGYFRATVDGKQAGLMSYNNTGQGEFVIDHTIVDNNFSAQSVGRGMVMEAVEYARRRRMRIIPLCSLARYVLSRVEGVKDVLAHYSLVP